MNHLKQSLSIDEYQVEIDQESNMLIIYSEDAADVIFGLGRYDNRLYYEGSTYTVVAYRYIEDKYDGTSLELTIKEKINNDN